LTLDVGFGHDLALLEEINTLTNKVAANVFSFELMWGFSKRLFCDQSVPAGLIRNGVSVGRGLRGRKTFHHVLLSLRGEWTYLRLKTHV
jgi:hypothetical protein